MKATAVKRSFESPIFTYCRKHRCPNCGGLLERVKVTKVVNSSSPEAEYCDLSLGDAYLVGDVKRIETAFRCPNCGREYTAADLRERAVDARNRLKSRPVLRRMLSRYQAAFVAVYGLWLLMLALNLCAVLMMRLTGDVDCPKFTGLEFNASYMALGVMGAVFFGQDVRLCLQSGVSRRRFLREHLLAALIGCCVFTLTDGLLDLVSILFPGNTETLLGKLAYLPGFLAFRFPHLAGAASLGCLVGNLLYRFRRWNPLHYAGIGGVVVVFHSSYRSCYGYAGLSGEDRIFYALFMAAAALLGGLLVWLLTRRLPLRK